MLRTKYSKQGDSSVYLVVKWMGSGARRTCVQILPLYYLLIELLKGLHELGIMCI